MDDHRRPRGRGSAPKPTLTSPLWEHRSTKLRLHRGEPEPGNAGAPRVRARSGCYPNSEALAQRAAFRSRRWNRRREGQIESDDYHGFLAAEQANRQPVLAEGVVREPAVPTFQHQTARRAGSSARICWVEWCTDSAADLRNSGRRRPDTARFWTSEETRLDRRCASIRPEERGRGVALW
jgi:hypothetical protein